MSWLAIIAYNGLLDLVLWVVPLAHPPTEAFCFLKVSIHFVIVSIGSGPGHQLIIFIADQPHHLLDDGLI
jgi:hypothetical protein